MGGAKSIVASSPLLLAGAPQDEQKRTLSEIPVPQEVQVSMNFLETVYRLSRRFVLWGILLGIITNWLPRLDCVRGTSPHKENNHETDFRSCVIADVVCRSGVGGRRGAVSALTDKCWPAH